MADTLTPEEEASASWSELRALWDKRDSRYRLRRLNGRPLQVSSAELVAIREYRRGEIATLPQAERPRAVLKLNRWYPPVAA